MISHTGGAVESLVEVRRRGKDEGKEKIRERTGGDHRPELHSFAVAQPQAHWFGDFALRLWPAQARSAPEHLDRTGRAVYQSR